jgi:hypothetical protein
MNMKSMTIGEITFGILGYADKIAIDEADPLAILIAEESGDEEMSGYGKQSQFLEA